MSTKQLIVIIIGGTLLFTLGAGIGYLLAREANPTPIIIETRSAATEAP